MFPGLPALADKSPTPGQSCTLPKLRRRWDFTWRSSRTARGSPQWRCSLWCGRRVWAVALAGEDDVFHGSAG